MSNGRIDEAGVDLMLADLAEDSPERKRARYMLVTLAETRGDITTLTGRVASIAQHCRYCDDNDEAPERDKESDRQHWLMWMVGSGLVNKVILPLAVGAGGVLLTLAITGQLGG